MFIKEPNLYVEISYLLIFGFALFFTVTIIFTEEKKLAKEDNKVYQTQLCRKNTFTY